MIYTDFVLDNGQLIRVACPSIARVVELKTGYTAARAAADAEIAAVVFTNFLTSQ